MEGKNTGAIITAIFVIILSAIIGSCFMAFVYADKKVLVSDPKIFADSGIIVADEKENLIEELTLSTSKLGLKPVTSEEDSETLIPFSVTDSVGSEGLYASFWIKTASSFKMIVKDISIEAPGNAESEREHIKVGLLDIKDSVKDLAQSEVQIYQGGAETDFKKFTFFVWLHGHTGQELTGAKISFNLYFQSV